MAEPPIRNLRRLLKLLRQRGELVEVAAPVDPNQELAEIHRRVIAAGGPALLFTHVLGSPHPVATNLFGTPQRVELAFGDRPLRFVEQAVAWAERLMPPSARTLWQARGLARQAWRIGLRRRRRGPVLAEQEAPPRLTQLPLLTCWPRDGGAFLTWPLVLTRSPRDGRLNLGVYRMQRYSDTELGMHWQIAKGGGFHYYEAEQRGQALPVTVLLGGPPALTLAAVAPLPEGVPELLLASLVLGERLPVIARPDLPHPVPAEVEFAIVGRVEPGERRPEGPFGDHYGYYSLRHDYPVFRAERLWRRRGAIFPATVVGKPCQEDYFIGNYLQRLLKPLFPLVMPGVCDLWSYGETGFHSLAAAVVRERYGREAMVSAFRILGEGQLALTKFLLLVDRPMDLTNVRAVLAHILARFRPETDLYVFADLAMDTLDYTGPRVNTGSKGVIVGIGEPVRSLPEAWSGAPPAGAHDPHVFCPGCLVLGGPAYAEDPTFPRRLAADPALAPWPLVVLCDRPARTAASPIDFLWTTFTRFEPAADLYAAATQVVRNRLRWSGPVVIDARMKPWYPDEVAADPDVAWRVTQRWREYFPDRRVEMGPGDTAHLTG